MENTVANTLVRIEREANDKLKFIFNHTENEWKVLYAFLKQKQNLDFFNGTCFLLNVTMDGVSIEAIVILSEQNLDFLVVFNENDSSIDLYFFNHYYNEEGDDSSLLEDLLVGKKFEGYTPMIRISHNPVLQENPIQHFNELYTFYMTTYKAIGVEMKKSNWKDDEALWLEVEERIHEQLNALFKIQKDKIVQLYLQLKDQKEGLSFGELRAYVKNMKIRSNKKEELNEIDSMFEKLFNRKLLSLSKEEKEARYYRDALILDDENEQFVTVFRTLEDNDMHQNQLISLYYCVPNDERFTNLSFLVSEFQHFKNHPIYEIHFDHDKYRNDVFYSAGSFSSDIRYFPYLSKFLIKLSQVEAVI